MFDYVLNVIMKIIEIIEVIFLLVWEVFKEIFFCYESLSYMEKLLFFWFVFEDDDFFELFGLVFLFVFDGIFIIFIKLVDVVYIIFFDYL